MAGESIEMRTIGEFSLPAVGVGCWSFGSKEGEYWGHREQEKTNAIVSAALKHGPITFFDTAEVSVPSPALHRPTLPPTHDVLYSARHMVGAARCERWGVGDGT
jgi:hypothetical protein